MIDQDKRRLGCLYTWSAAVGFASWSESHAQATDFSGRRQGICPNGWHLPTRAEWKTLEETAGGKEIAGGALKSQFSWDADGEGTDNYLFEALPSGSGTKNGVRYVGRSAYFWTPNACSVLNAHSVALDSSTKKMFTDECEPKVFLNSVRCVKN